MRETPLPIGTRVMAVSHNEGNKLFVFGRGVFEGYFLPAQIDVPKQIAAMKAEYAVMAAVTPELPADFTEAECHKALLLSEANPRIRLTETLDGTPLDEVIWGYECWWSDEETFNSKSAGKYEFVTKTVAAHREEVEKMSAMEEEFRSAISGVVSSPHTEIV